MQTDWTLLKMLKAFAPVMLMLLLFATRLEKPNIMLISSIVIISFGTFLAAFGEIAFSWVGVFVMLTSEFFESTKLVCMQILLTNFKFSVIEGLYYMAPAAAIWLGIISVCTEDVGAALGKMGERVVVFLFMCGKCFVFSHILYSYAYAAAHPMLFIVAGFLGFGVNLGGFLVVKTCSALTLRVLGLFRNMAIVVASAFFLGDIVTAGQYIAYMISVSGMLVYQHSRKHPELTDEVIINYFRGFIDSATPQPVETEEQKLQKEVLMRTQSSNNNGNV